MNGIVYGIVEERYKHENQERKAYGIVAYANADREGSATVVASARDICVERERVEQLSALCNRLALDPAQLSDVVEDFLP